MEANLLQVTSDAQVINSVFNSPITVSTIFGLLVFLVFQIIRWLAKRYEKVEQDKTDIAKEFVKLMVSVENKMDSDKSDNSEIKLRLDKLIELVSKWSK